MKNGMKKTERSYSTSLSSNEASIFKAGAL